MTLKEDAEVSIESFTYRGWQTLGRGLRLAEVVLEPKAPHPSSHPHSFGANLEMQYLHQAEREKVRRGFRHRLPPLLLSPWFLQASLEKSGRRGDVTVRRAKH